MLVGLQGLAAHSISARCLALAGHHACIRQAQGPHVLAPPGVRCGRLSSTRPDVTPMTANQQFAAFGVEMAERPVHTGWMDEDAETVPLQPAIGANTPWQRFRRPAWCTDAVVLLVVGTLSVLLCLLVVRVKTSSQLPSSTPILGLSGMQFQHLGSGSQTQPTSSPSSPASGLQQAPAPRTGAPATGKQPWGPFVRPVVIAHRGASTEYPEHTREAYLRAIEEGADVIECDVVLTRDLVGVCRHEPNLMHSTDVMKKFPDRLKTEVIDGEHVTGVFTADLTLAEIRTLRAVQPWPFRNHSWDGQLPLVTLDEYLDIALSAPRTVGVYPETKNPTWHNTLPQVRAAQTSIEAVLLRSLNSRGYQGPMHSAQWRQQPAFIQSFETKSLEALAEQTCLPLIHLLGGNMSDIQPDGRTVAELLSPTSLDYLSQMVVGLGPGKTLLAEWRPGGGGDHLGTGRYWSSGVVERIHRAGLMVHPYTVREEPRFVMAHLAGNVTHELHLLLEQLGVDGLFSDSPGAVEAYLDGGQVQTAFNTTLANMERKCTVVAAKTQGSGERVGLRRVV